MNPLIYIICSGLGYLFLVIRFRQKTERKSYLKQEWDDKIELLGWSLIIRSFLIILIMLTAMMILVAVYKSIF